MAYNSWGGKSSYGYNSTNNVDADIVSLLRPGQNKIVLQEIEFSAWADNNGIDLEYASMMDIETNPNLLKNYNLIVTAGHNEYWSANMRSNFDNYIKSGGNAMILSGNTMWWQIRIEADKMVAYRSNAKYNDPMLGINPSLVTDNWSSDVVNNPENSSIGVSFRNGGYVNYNGILQADLNDPYNDNGGFTVIDASHWIYAETGLENGDVFGKSTTIVGYETDGALFITDNQGKLQATGTDGTPENFKILATAVANAGYATMGISQPFLQGGDGI